MSQFTQMSQFMQNVKKFNDLVLYHGYICYILILLCYEEHFKPKFRFIASLVIGTPSSIYDRYLYGFSEPPGCLLTPYHSGMCGPPQNFDGKEISFLDPTWSSPMQC